jgi:HlyD family secretion protein
MINRSVFRTASIGISLLLVTSCGEKRETITVTKNDIVEAVYSSLNVEPTEMYVVNSAVSGYIESFFVEIGDTVFLGQELFRIKDDQSSANSLNAQLAYEMARRNFSGDVSLLEEIKLNIDNAELKRQNDSVNYARNKILYAKTLLTKVELDQSELVFNSSKNNHIGLINKLQRTEKELKTSLNQAKNNYASSASRSNDANVRNRIAGLVYDIMKEEGEFVSPQEPVAIIGSDDKFTLKMLIDEVDIIRLKLGQTIYVSLEAYPNQTFEAKVTRINPKLDTRTQTFEVDGEFTKPPASLYMGLTGEGNIIITERKNVLTIPREYLIGNNRVETEDGEIEVKIGAKSLSHVEILGGLKEGQMIYKPL